MEAIICDFCGVVIKLDGDSDWYKVTKFSGRLEYINSKQYHACETCFEKLGGNKNV